MLLQGKNRYVETLEFKLFGHDVLWWTWHILFAIWQYAQYAQYARCQYSQYAACHHGYRRSRLCIPAARRWVRPTGNVASSSRYSHIVCYCKAMQVTYTVAPAFLADWLCVPYILSKMPPILPPPKHRESRTACLHVRCCSWLPEFPS
jgi:hypothetical protein